MHSSLVSTVWTVSKPLPHMLQTCRVVIKRSEPANYIKMNLSLTDYPFILSGSFSRSIPPHPMQRLGGALRGPWLLEEEGYPAAIPGRFSTTTQLQINRKQCKRHRRARKALLTTSRMNRSPRQRLSWVLVLFLSFHNAFLAEKRHLRAMVAEEEKTLIPQPWPQGRYLARNVEPNDGNVTALHKNVGWWI